MIVIIGGPDRSGKTEISKELSAQLGIPRFKSSYEHFGITEDPSIFVQKLRHSSVDILDFAKQTKTSYIQDRGHCCEWVYSRLYGRKTDDHAMWYLDRMHAAMGAKVLLCLRTSYLGCRDDLVPEYLSNQKLDECAQLYRDFAKWTKCESYELNVDSENTVAQVKEVLKWLKG